MDYIITIDCSLKEKIVNIDKPAVQLLEYLVKPISSVRKIIVTDCDFENYRNSVKEYSIEIDDCVQVTKNGVAVVIHGLNSQNVLEQYIFIRGDIFYSFCMYSCGQEFFEFIRENCGDEQASSSVKCANLAIKFVLHEIGHAIDYENLFMTYGYLPVTQKQYYLPKDLKEYAEREAMTIWSEYFAERYALSHIQNTDIPSVDEIKELLSDTFSQGVVTDIGKIFRLLYWFAFYIAYYHSKTETYALSIQNDHQDIMALLNELSNTLERLYNESSNWEFESEFANLGGLFIKIYELKYLS